MFFNKKSDDNDEFLNYKSPIDAIDDIDKIREKNYLIKNKVFLQGTQGKEDISSQVLTGAQKDFDIKININPMIKENHFTSNENNEGLLNINEQTWTNTKNVFNLPFEFVRRFGPDKYTKKDIVRLDKKSVKITNSILFYFNNYWKKQEFYKFHSNYSKFPSTVKNF